MELIFCTHGHLENFGKRGFTFGSRYSGIKYVVKYASLLPVIKYFDLFHVNANSHLLFNSVFFNSNFLKANY